MKQKIRLTETQLRNVIREAIEEVFDDDSTGFFRANQAGLAQKAKNSLRAKFDPEYRARKARQYDTFMGHDKDNIPEPHSKFAANQDFLRGYELGLKGCNLGTANSQYDDFYDHSY